MPSARPSCIIGSVTVAFKGISKCCEVSCGESISSLERSRSLLPWTSYLIGDPHAALVSKTCWFSLWVTSLLHLPLPFRASGISYIVFSFVDVQVLCGFTDHWGSQVEQTLWGVPVLCPGKHTGHCEVRACLQRSAAGICQHLTARQWHVSRKISGESWVLSWSQALHKHVALNSMFSFLKGFEYRFWEIQKSLKHVLFSFFLSAWKPFDLFFALSCGMWDLSSPTRDQTCAHCIGSRVLATGLPGEVPESTLKLVFYPADFTSWLFNLGPSQKASLLWVKIKEHPQSLSPVFPLCRSRLTASSL